MPFLCPVPEGRSRGASGLPARQLKRGERGSVPASAFARRAMPRDLFECWSMVSGRDKKHENLLRLVTAYDRERSPKKSYLLRRSNFNGSWS